MQTWRSGLLVALLCACDPFSSATGGVRDGGSASEASVTDSGTSSPEAGDSGGKLDGTEAGAQCDASLCEDFDDDAVFTRWTKVGTTSRLTLVKLASAPSQPNALQVRTAAAGPLSAFAERTIQYDSGVSCRIALKANTGTSVQTFLELHTDTIDVEFSMFSERKVQVTVIGASKLIRNSNILLSTDRFEDFHFEIGSAGRLSFGVGSESEVVSESIEFGSSPMQLRLGSRERENRTATMLYDNVRCTWP
jgi:hypothetical protein